MEGTRGRVLIVDDDTEVRELIAMELQDRQWLTVEAKDGMEAIRLCREQRPDLVLLDVMMPGMDGFEVCRRIREQSSVPVIFLTSRQLSEDIVRGLDVGADDYITKPFDPAVLEARLNSSLRRIETAAAADTIRFGELLIQPDSGEARYRGNEIPFLAKELKLLCFLAEHPKQLFSAETLYDAVWKYGEGDFRTVMVHISNIRKKLERYAPNTVRIDTVKGMGYRLIPEDRTAKRSAMPTVREATIEAASELFAQRGYEGMTMKEVARRAGVHPSAIYALFRNKEDVFLHIYRNTIGHHVKLATDSAPAPDGRTIRERIDDMLRTIMHFQLSNPGKMKIFVRMLMFPDGHIEHDMKAELNKAEQEEWGMLAQWFQEGMERGEIRRGDSGGMASVLICLMDGLFWEMQRYGEQPFQERFEAVWEQFWALVKA
ncbi:response regulator [Paenibacillus koleovorans]|uniref:response regulator n=1 Tax=Paenibacillus koleovorans TaxID=121608 RepID=UPI000FD7AD7E|nr:response regulator [Paenibacillus koleovorans]